MVAAVRHPLQFGKRLLRKALDNVDQREPIHFLHVRKAAGSQIKVLANALNDRNSKVRIIQHPHNISLRNLPKSERYFFSVRDPSARFRSGFYSRKRCGQPKNYNPWSDDERMAFETFEHANDLAEALFEPTEKGLAAARAILSIRHTASTLTDWFQFHGHFAELQPPVWIIRQERFAEDMAILIQRLGLPADILGLTGKSERIHANDYSDIPELSPKATANLKRWYAPDFELLRLCDQWLEQNAPPTSGTTERSTL